MEFRDKVLSYKDDIVNDLSNWIKKDSVYDESTVSTGAPFGKGVKNSLDYIANLAIKDGFKVTNYDGYCVEIEFGKGDELIGIFGHGDVVPEGKGWIHDPYKGIVENNLVYGRGSSDDKGPSLCAYYALKILRDSGIKPTKTIRLVIGGNEERGSACLNYYFNKIKRPHPTYGFTPDADFPLIYGEKGILGYHYFGEFKDNLIKEIDAGIVSNAVPGEAIFKLKEEFEITPKFIKLCKKYHLGYEYKNKTLKFIGKSSHAAFPQAGINALSLGLYILSKTTNSAIANHFGPLFKDYYGSKLGIAFKSKDMGKLTVIEGIAKYKNNKYDFNLNIRYPIGTNGQKIKNALDSHIKDEGELLGDTKPLYIDPKSKFIKVLLDSYKKVTKDFKAKPITIGGGTYAKETINTVAFGMDFHRNNGTGNIHTIEEAINIDDLVDGCEIYCHAIKGLLDL